MPWSGKRVRRAQAWTPVVIATCVVLWQLSAVPSAAASCDGADVEPSASDGTQAISATVCLLNANRVANGDAPLRWNGDLGGAAQSMADDMVAREFFSHVTPSGDGLVERVKSTGYLPRGDNWSLGENLAWGYELLGSPAAIVAGWMQSPEHRSNMLSADYPEVGVGYAAGAPVPGFSGGAVFVADFGHSIQPRRTRARCRRRRRCRARWVTVSATSRLVNLSTAPPR
jgi:uncharacterized protein YkwD